MRLRAEQRTNSLATRRLHSIVLLQRVANVPQALAVHVSPGVSFSHMLLLTASVLMGHAALREQSACSSFPDGRSVAPDTMVAPDTQQP